MMTGFKALFFCLIASSLFVVVGAAQAQSTQTISATQQATFGWTWARSAIENCGSQVAWNTTTGKPITARQAEKLLVGEGHKRRDVLKAMQTRSMGSFPFIQLDRWFDQAGFKPNAQNVERLTCELAVKVAGTNHAMGRFLKRQ